MDCQGWLSWILTVNFHRKGASESVAKDGGTHAERRRGRVLKGKGMLDEALKDLQRKALALNGCSVAWKTPAG